MREGAAVEVAVAAPHRLAVEAAREVVEAGGNAVDAAVAAAMALTVVYPHQCSVGGDLFALVRRPDGTVVSVNGSGAYGSRIAPVPGAPVPVTGPGSVSVPGVVSGWQRLVESAGALPAGRLLEPAIALAERGVPVGERLAGAIAEMHDDGIADDGLRALLTTGDGRPVAVGDTLDQGRLATTLHELAVQGLDTFYRGRLADRLARGFEELGVPVGREDLRRHQAVEETPLVADLAGFRLSTSRPNSQGYLLLSTMLAMQELAASDGPTGPSTLVDLFALAETRRTAELADPRFMVEDVEELLSPRRIAADVSRLMTAGPGAGSGARVRSGAGPATTRRSGDTVAVTAVASDGTAVSLIQSLFHSFGSGLRDPDTGIVLHNRASSFSADPASPNVIGAGKRPAHTLMPVLVEYADGRVSAHGTMGGRAQPQIHTQVMLACLAGRSAQDAVAAPRFRVGAMEAGVADHAVLAEPDLPEETLAALRASGRPVQVGTRLDEEVGHAMIATRAPDGALEAGADPRSDGGAAVVALRA